MQPTDLLVIGGGAAAAAAALEARAHDMSVIVVRRAPGASALSRGGWTGPLPGPIAHALVRQHLVHVDLDGPLPHPDGELRHYDFAPASHAAARVETGACVVGIEGLPVFRPRALARLWGDAAGAELTHETTRLAGTPPAGWAPLALARAIQADAAPLAVALRDIVARTRCTRLVVPAVLGIERTGEIRERLEAETGVPVGEALGVAPSVPGWRLHRALEGALIEAGVQVVDGSVADVEQRAGRCTGVDVVRHGSDQAERFAAERFLLASGRYVGGGIVADPVFAEPVFGAAVWIDHLGERFEEVDSVALTDPVRTEEQPLMRAGVRVDGSHRLRRPGGDALANVWAAGSVRAGVADGLGAAAEDGVVAVTRMLSATA
ncbi:MAG TPA: FAD-binding protein [Longimicrobiales bacterium]|nr:FAD-binding protein [Longimicrobiales bacterium]